MESGALPGGGRGEGGRTPSEPLALPVALALHFRAASVCRLRGAQSDNNSAQLAGP
jgi:hypothetical protein